jgi:dTDP-4-amino-4,6-dideoxygalactose transaminase
MLPRLKPYLGLKEILAFFHFWKQDSVKKFEDKFADIANVSYSLSFSYGRTALYAILKSFFPDGGEVICPSYTCVVVPHAIVTAGCTPVFVDSHPADFNMDLELCEHVITNKTVAIIITSIFGHPIHTKQVELLKKKHPHLLIIQDCAHSFFAYDEGKPVHQVGDFAIFAFNISKMMTSIFGGMLTTNNKIYYEKLSEFSAVELKNPPKLKSFRRFIYMLSVYIAFNCLVYGIVNKIERLGLLNKFVKYFDPSIIDMPSDYLEGLTPFEGRVGAIQCDKLEIMQTHRKKIAGIYFKELNAIKEFQLPPQIEGVTYSHFVVVTTHAEQLCQFMLTKGVQLGELIDYNIPELPSYSEHTFLDNGIATKWPGNVINLPVHMGVDKKEALIISRTLLYYCGRLETSGKDGPSCN